MEIAICRRLSSPLSYLRSNVLVWQPCFKMTTPDLIVQELLQTFLSNTMLTGWIGHRIPQISTPLSMYGTSWNIDIQSKHAPPSNHAHLARMLVAEWQATPQAFFQRLVNSMRWRCADCINARGGYTHY